MVATRLDDGSDDILLANVRLGDVLNLRAGGRRQFLGIRPYAVAQRFGKARIVKDANVLRVQKARHSHVMARSRQRACNHNPVVTRQHARNPVPVAFNKRCIHRSLHLVSQNAVTLTFLVPARPA